MLNACANWACVPVMHSALCRAVSHAVFYAVIYYVSYAVIYDVSYALIYAVPTAARACCSRVPLCLKTWLHETTASRCTSSQLTGPSRCATASACTSQLRCHCLHKLIRNDHCSRAPHQHDQGRAP